MWVCNSSRRDAATATAAASTPGTHMPMGASLCVEMESGMTAVTALPGARRAHMPALQQGTSSHSKAA